MSLKGLKPPPPPVLPATSSELAAKFSRVTRIGGSRAASACGGDFPLKAPTCGENIDPSAFTIRWPATISRTVAILVERADGQPALFRGTAAGAAGEFASQGLAAFLRATQNQSEAVDITVRVLAEGGKSAVRLVHIPPSVRTQEFEARVRAVGLGIDASRGVTLMLLAMGESMWSRAAEEASELMKLAGTSVSLLEYALVGLCRSDFSEEKALLGNSIPAKRYGEICAPEPASTTDVSAVEASSPGTSPVTDAPTRSRLGIALLIGNSDTGTCRSAPSRTISEAWATP